MAPVSREAITEPRARFADALNVIGAAGRRCMVEMEIGVHGLVLLGSLDATPGIVLLRHPYAHREITQTCP